jgi:hypothetical protein
MKTNSITKSAPPITAKLAAYVVAAPPVSELEALFTPEALKHMGNTLVLL